MFEKNKYLKGLVSSVLFLVLVLFSNLAHAEGEQYQPNSEKGDALFRLIVYTFQFKKSKVTVGTVPHVGIYLNSDSKFIRYAPLGNPRRYEDLNINEVEIKSSNMEHSLIQANGTGPANKGLPLSIRDFEGFMDTASYPEDYYGAYNNGDLNSTKRRDLIHYAWEQRGSPYFYDSWPGIKEPWGQDLNGDGVYGSFRCDGLVEYVYEKIGYDFRQTGSGKEGDLGFFTEEEEKSCWFIDEEGNFQFPAFWTYPLMVNMGVANVLNGGTGKAEVNLPEVNITDPDPNEEMKTIGGTYTLEAFASDGENGSGIDRVEFWEGEPDDTPGEVPGLLLGIDDHDTSFDKPEEKHIYKYDWNTTEKDANGDPLFPDGEYAVYAKAFDQVGNTQVSEGVLVKVGWDWTVMYEANELPTAADPPWKWTYSYWLGEPDISVNQGILTINNYDPVTAPACYYQRKNSTTNSIGNVLEARVKVTTSGNGAERLWLSLRGASSSSMTNDGTSVEIYLYNNRITIGGQETVSYDVNTRDDFHIYRIAIKGDTYWFYYDGILLHIGRPRGGFNGVGYINFGNHKCNGQWDYVRYYTGGFQ